MSLTLLGTLFAFASFFYAFYTLFKRRTLLSLGATLLFSLNTLFACIASYQQYQLNTELLIITFFTLANFLYLFCAIFIKQHAPVATYDWPLFIFSFILLFFHLVSQNPIYTLIISTLIECCATVWVLFKMNRHPNQEALIPWLLAGLSYLCSTITLIHSQNTNIHHLAAVFSGAVCVNCFTVVVLGIAQSTRK